VGNFSEGARLQGRKKLEENSLKKRQKEKWFIRIVKIKVSLRRKINNNK
jgi:hypothetical protein